MPPINSSNTKASMNNNKSQINKTDTQTNIHSIIKTLIRNKNCELLLKLNPSPRDNFTFTNYDILRGELIFNNKQPNSFVISGITLSLEGYSKSCIPDKSIATEFRKQLYGNPAITLNVASSGTSDNDSGFIENPLLKQTNINFLQYHMNVECHKLLNEEVPIYSIYDSNGSIKENQISTTDDHKEPFSILIPSETFCCTGTENYEPDINKKQNPITAVDSENFCDKIFHIDPLNNSKIGNVVDHCGNLFLSNKMDTHSFFDNERKILQYHLPPTLHNPGADIYDVAYFLKATITMVPKKYTTESNLASSNKTFGFRKSRKSESTDDLKSRKDLKSLMKEKQTQYHGYYEINFLPRESSVDIAKRDGKLDCVILTKCKLFSVNEVASAYDSSKQSNMETTKSQNLKETSAFEKQPNAVPDLSSDEDASTSEYRDLIEMKLKKTNEKIQSEDVSLGNNKDDSQNGLPSKVSPKREKIIINRSPRIQSIDESSNVWLELRFTESDYFTPSTTPVFKLFLVSNLDPDLLNSEQSNPKETDQIGYIDVSSIDIDLLEFTILENQIYFDKLKQKVSSRSSKSSGTTLATKLKPSKLNSSSLSNGNTFSDKLNEGSHNNSENDVKFIKNHYTRSMNILRTSSKFSHQIYLTSKSKVPGISKRLTRYNSFIKNDSSNIRSTRGTIYESEIPLYEFDNLSINAPNKGYPGLSIPSYIAPSFKTCNVKRDYKFIVRFGYSLHRCKENIVFSENNETMGARNGSGLQNFANIKSKSKNSNSSGMNCSIKKATFATKIKILSGISNIIEDHVISMNSLNSYPDLPSYEEIFYPV